MVARNRVVISGQIDAGGAAGTDEWSVGFHYGAPGTVVEGQQALTDWANSIGNLLTETLNYVTLKTALTTRGSIRSVACYQYGASGPAVGVGAADFTVIGTSAANKPAQCAVVATLNTGLAGRSYRGRAYWPMLGYAFLNSTLVLEQSTCSAIATAMAQLLTDIGQAAGDPQPALGVYSATRDVMTPVTSISVGNVIDTQRRRRSELVETKQSSTYPQ